MDVRLVEHGDPSASGLLAVTAQRLLAESLTNALKHGDLAATRSRSRRTGATATVSSCATGCGPRRAALGTGHGLTGMRDRVTMAGGTFEAGASDGTWTVRAELPEPAA